jgi:hypothetical protein
MSEPHRAAGAQTDRNHDIPEYGLIDVVEKPFARLILVGDQLVGNHRDEAILMQPLRQRSRPSRQLAEPVRFARAMVVVISVDLDPMVNGRQPSV